MANLYKLKIASLDDVLKRVLGLGDEDSLELEVKEREAIIKVAKFEAVRQTKAPAQALLDFMDGLPEPAAGEESTNYASHVDDILYHRDRHF